MPTQKGEYYLFAGLILAAGFIFVLIAVFYYDYVQPGEFDAFEYPGELVGFENESVSSSSESERPGKTIEKIKEIVEKSE